jgi:hypothetical protein
VDALRFASLTVSSSCWRVVVDAAVDDVDDVDDVGGEVVLEQAARVTVRTTIPIEPSLRMVIIVPPIVRTGASRNGRPTAG